MRDRLHPLLHGRTGLWLGLAVFALLLWASWVGFLASDDVTYARGAHGWLEHFPYVGGHGTIRYPITIPMALSFLTFGGNEFAMVLPSLLYIVAFLWVAWRVARDVAGAGPAFVALLALVTSPLIVVQSTIAGVDVIEMAFLFGAVVLTWRCLDEGPDPRLLFAAGALAGCAFLTRETAIFIVPFFAMLFLRGAGFARRHYLWIPLGFVAVWGLELIYLGAMTGDPLYRFNISLHHDSTIDRSVDLAGNVLVHPLVDPVLVLLLNQEFMALFFLAVPATAWLCLGRSVEPRLRRFARLTALFGAVWFVCVAAAQSLLPLNPRYFMITSSMACLLTGLALGELIGKADGRARLAGWAALAVLIGGNLVGLSVENREPAFGETVLAELAAARPDARIATDPATRRRADLLLRWEGVGGRVSDAPPRPGDLYLHNPARAPSPDARTGAEAPGHHRPGSDWTPLRRWEPDPSRMAAILEATGCHRAVPESLWRKLRHRGEAVTLYRVG